MGCGKSSVGRRLSGLTGHRFVDTDELIVQAEGRSIPEIFAQHGEEYFREAETRALEGTLETEGIILSTGGGLILRAQNRELLPRIGIVAWLDAQPEILFERASRSGKRPLMQTENPWETFKALLDSRREIYTATADFRIDSSDLSHDDVAQALLDEALRHGERFE
ncbi:shikimate kinase [soil metagenome]